MSQHVIAHQVASAIHPRTGANMPVYDSAEQVVAEWQANTPDLDAFARMMSRIAWASEFEATAIEVVNLRDGEVLGSYLVQDASAAVTI